MIIGIDVGGTFTDLVVTNGSGTDFVKVPSTPDDPARGVVDALQALAARQKRSLGDLLPDKTTYDPDAGLLAEDVQKALAHLPARERRVIETRYGLSGAVWSADQDRAVAFARRVRTGSVDVNGGAYNPMAPFGGYKQSGLGRELGRFGLEEFTEIKSIQL